MSRRESIMTMFCLGLFFTPIWGTIILFVWTFFCPDLREYFNRIPFDSATWKDPTLVHSSGAPVRIRMVDDLLWRYRLVGMSRSKIDELLGPPTQTGYFGAYDYVYWLGPERSYFSIDSEWLVIKIRNGRVVEAHIASD